MTLFQIAITIIIITSILITPLIIIVTPLIITEYIRYSDKNKSEYEDNRKTHIIKFVGSFETSDKYDLIGIWGFSKKHIMHKIKRLEQNGITYDGIYTSLREVKHFPSYCEWIV